MRFLLSFIFFATQGFVLTFNVPDNLIHVDHEIEEYFKTELEKLDVVENAYFSSSIQLVKMSVLGHVISKENDAITEIQRALFNSFEYFSLPADDRMKLAQGFYALFQDDFDFYALNECLLPFEICFVLKQEDEYSGKLSLVMLPKGQKKNNPQSRAWVFVTRSKLVD